MKKQNSAWYRMVLGMFVLLTVGIGHAQYEGPVVKVKVPFNFNIGQKEFSAGEYSLKTTLQNVVSLRDEAGHAVTNIQTNSVESGETPRSAKLVFVGYGGQYFLAQIWQAGDSIGREVVKSSAEIEMAKKYSPGQKIAVRLVARQ